MSTPASALREPLLVEEAGGAETVKHPASPLERAFGLLRLRPRLDANGVPCPKPPKPLFKPVPSAIALLLFIILLAAPLIDSQPERHGFALFALAASVWATNAFPAWVMGLAVPVLATALGLPPDQVVGAAFRKEMEAVVLPMMRALNASGNATWGNTTWDSHLPRALVHQPIQPKQRAQTNLASLANPVVYLLLASFALGSALHKHGVDTRLAAAALARASSVGPRTVLVGILGFTHLASAVVGNAAASVTVLLLLMPLLRACPRATFFPQACVTAVVLGASIGGMATPVSSGQNAAAVQVITSDLGCEIGFGRWVGATAPPCLVYLAASYGIVQVYWRHTLTELPALPMHPEAAAPMTRQAVAVAAISCATVLAWALSSVLEPFFGNIGLLSLLPVMLLWGAGLMDKADFLGLDWSVMMLLGGGCCLGDTLENCGALDAIANRLQAEVGTWPPSLASAVFSFVVLFAANFVSHIVAALAFLPLVARAATSDAAAAVISATVADSCAMMLPVSSLPNMIAYSSKDADGKAYMTTKDFLRVGFMLEVVVFAFNSTVGFQLCAAVMRHACDKSHT